MISIMLSPNSRHQREHAEAVSEGLKILGVEHKFSTIGQKSPFQRVICWGWKNGKIMRQLGHDVLVMERGYIGDRFNYTSLGWNGLNGYASFPEYPLDQGERFKQHGGEILGWRRKGDYALIMGQVKNDASLKGQNIEIWYKQVAEDIKRIYGIPVYFRPHPEAARRGGYLKVDGLQNMGGDLKTAMNGALFTVCYNSNSAVDSILNGTPCYAGDKGTMAWKYCMKDLSELYYPDRENIKSLAWTQWTKEEIASGFPLVKLLEI